MAMRFLCLRLFFIWRWSFCNKQVVATIEILWHSCERCVRGFRDRSCAGLTIPELSQERLVFSETETNIRYDTLPLCFVFRCNPIQLIDRFPCIPSSSISRSYRELRGAAEPTNPSPMQSSMLVSGSNTPWQSEVTI